MSGTFTSNDTGYNQPTIGFGVIHLSAASTNPPTNRQLKFERNSGLLSPGIGKLIGLESNLDQGEFWEIEIIRDVNDHLVVNFIKNGNVTYSLNTLYTNLRQPNQTFTFADVGGIRFHMFDISSTDLQAEIVEI